MSNLFNINNFDIKNFDINNFDLITKQKMLFIYNSLENGWTITKQDDKYIFIKKHNNSSEVLSDEYLRQFIINHLK